MIRLYVTGAFVVIASVVWLVQQAQAHGRKLNPNTFQPVLGPIERVYPHSVADGPDLIRRAALQVPGMSVAAVVGNAVFLNSRPNFGRLDDGAGFFIRVISTAQQGTWHLRFEGQPKTSLSASDSARRGFLSVERHLRQALATMGYRIADGLEQPAEMSSAAPARVRPPAIAPKGAFAPPPAVGTAAAPERVAVLASSSGERRMIEQQLCIGRDPSGDASARWAIADPMASKTHAVVTWRSGRVLVRDCRSTNGTLLERRGDSRSAVPDVEEELSDGDTFVIGAHRFRVEIGATR